MKKTKHRPERRCQHVHLILRLKLESWYLTYVRNFALFFKS